MYIREGSPHTVVSAATLRLFVGCLMSQQHASVSQRRIRSDNRRCCLAEIEAADQTCYLTQSEYCNWADQSTAKPASPGAWQGSHWSANLQVTGMTRPGKFHTAKAGIEAGLPVVEGQRCDWLARLSVYCGRVR